MQVDEKALSEQKLKKNQNEIDELNMKLNDLLNEKSRLENDLYDLMNMNKSIKSTGN